MENRLECASNYILSGYPVQKILEFTKIHKTTWYRYKDYNTDRRRYNQGRPILGFSYTKYGTLVPDAEIVQKILQIRNEKYTITIQGENRFFYILVYIDVFSRMIVHFYIGLQCKAVNLAATFSTALRKNNVDPNIDLVIRSDHGPQMSSKKFYTYLSTEVQYKIFHEFIPCATPNKNAHVESFYSIVESEFIYPNYFKNFKNAYDKFSDFVKFYNEERVHSSLRYHTPREIIRLYIAKEILPKMKIISI